MIYERMVHSAQSVHLSCVKISTISKWTKSIFHLSLVTMEYHWMCPKWFLSLWCVRCKLCTYLLSRLTLFPNGLNQASTWASHLGVPSGASKMISEPTVHLAQTVHLSCVKISTISKQTESIFHLSQATMEYHWVRPKWFMSLWYVLCKPSKMITSGASKTISGPVVRSPWIVHLFCVKISTISKQNETSIHLSLVT
jgi:hypothetical protein